ncbi:hypothetical protein ACB092_03G089100 [Castanea dentata]
MAGYMCCRINLLVFFDLRLNYYGNMNLIYLVLDVQLEQRNPTLLFGRLFKKEHIGEKVICSYYMGSKRI